jgi:hypothetical protein
LRRDPQTDGAPALSVFAAWRGGMQALEHRMFGKDGFEDALKCIAAIEQAFGLSDLNALTSPAPPQIA